MSSYINIHTHHPTGAQEHLEIENLRYGQTGKGTSAYCSAGLHPWFLPEREMDTAYDWLKQQADRPAVIAIGEGGLDRVTDTPWLRQLAAFQRCVAVSEECQKPLIIHCVRAFSELVSLKKQWNPVQPWIIHGFDKNLQTGQILLDAGCFLSFGAALLQANSHTSAVLRMTPPDRFFLETDDSDIGIEAIYQRAADVLSCDVRTIQEQMQVNFYRVFTSPVEMDRIDKQSDR